MASKPDKAKVKKWLKDKGHGAAKIDAMAWDTEAERKQSFLELHGVSVNEWQRCTR